MNKDFQGRFALKRLTNYKRLEHHQNLSSNQAESEALRDVIEDADAEFQLMEMMLKTRRPNSGQDTCDIACSRSGVCRFMSLMPQHNVLNETSYLHYLLKSQELSQDIVNRLRSSQTYEHYSVRTEKFKRCFIPFSVNNYQ